MSPPGDASHDEDSVSIARTVSARIHHSVTILLRALSPLPPGRPLTLEPRPKGILVLGYLRSRVYVEAGIHDNNEASSANTDTMEPLSGRVFNTHSFRRVFLLQLVTTDQTELKTLVHNAHTWSRVKHANLHSVFGTCEDSPRTYAVQLCGPYFPAGDVVQAQPTLDRRAIVLGVARGLAALHSYDIVHGDVNIEHVDMTFDGRVLLGGFQRRCTLAPVARSDDGSLEVIPSWAKIRGTEPKPDPPQSSDLVEYRYRPDPEYHEPELFLAPQRAEFRSMLLSTDKPGDLFAFAFLMLSTFQKMSPDPNHSDLPLIRKILKAEPPRRPKNRSFQVFGLDNVHWEIMLRCWRFPPTASANADEIAQQLTAHARRDNIIICPVKWSLQDKERFVAQRRIPTLLDEISDVTFVQEGRDLERELYEVKAQLQIGSPVLREVKIIEPERHRRFKMHLPDNYLAEACVWSQLQHDNVLPLIGFYTLKRNGMNVPTLVVPWMAFGTCKDYLKAQPDADRVPIMLQVARALHYLHTRDPPIVHGDIRLHNVYVTIGGVVYLANFDFSPYEDPSAGFDHTDPRRIFLARRYSAPEGGALSPQTDIFAFSLFCWELYSGQKPYADQPAAIAATTLNGGVRPPRPPSLTSNPLWEKIQQGWRTTPFRRPTMLEYIEFFESRLAEITEPEPSVV